MIEDALAMGLEPPELTETDGPGFKVWPECWDAVRLFLRVQTQWRPGSSGVAGLDYGAVLTVADRLYPSGDSMALLEDLQIMEFRAIELINEKARAD